MAEVTVKKRIYCNHCKRDTNHALNGEHSLRTHDDDADFGEDLTHRLWICMGCESGVLEREYFNSDMLTSDGGEGLECFTDFSYYPERSQYNLAPKQYSKLKPKLASLYTEAIICYNREALILCAAGLRALLEGICQDKRIKGKNLKVKIDGLKTLLPNKNIIRNLHQFRFMGNEAVHELAARKSFELHLAIRILEDLLSFFYELDYKASQLREMRTPKRPRLPKPTKAVSATVTPTPNS